MSLSLTAGSDVLGAQVVLQEIPLSLYNKPVTGYRFTVDRSQRVVEQQILKHVADSDPTKPFQHDKTIIFENIRYRPITYDQPISLHFLLRGYENHYTQVTLVAMYDLRRSINSRDFPDMALRLQIDLARLLRKISGDILKFHDIVFDDAKIKELESKLAHQPVPPPDDVKASRNNVVVPERGFESSNGDTDSLILALKKRVQELEAREKEWLRQESNLRSQQREVDQKQSDLQSKLEENRYLKDSVEALNKRMKSLLGQYYVSDDISVTNETAEYIASLERDKKRQEQLLLALERANDSLARRVNETGMLVRENAKARQALADEIIRIKAENQALQEQVAHLQEELATRQIAEGGKSITDSLFYELRRALGQNAKQEEEMKALRTDESRLKKENEELTASVSGLQGRIADLEIQNKNLAKGTEPQPGQDLNVLRDSLASTRSRLSAVQSKLKEMEQKQSPGNKALAENKTLRDSLAAAEIRESSLRAKLRDAESRVGSNSKMASENKTLQDSLTAVRSRAGSLQVRLIEAEKKAALASKPAPPIGPSAETKALQDSLSLMKSRMSFLQTKLNEANTREKQGADREASLRLKEAENRTLQSKLTESQAQYNNSQSEKKRLEQQLATVQANLKTSQEAVSASKAEQDKLVKERASLQSKLSAAESNIGLDATTRKYLADSIVVLNRRVREMDGQILSRDKTLRQEIHRSDSLGKLLLVQQNRENDLKRQMVLQQNKVDSLTRLSMPVQDQQKFIRDQWAKLTEWEKQLEAKENSTANQEKLMAQKLSSVETREKEVSRRESAIVGLEERERQVSLREQQVNARENISGTMVNPADVKIVRLTEFGPSVPVFSVDTDLNFRAAQKQVVAYMLSRDILLNEQLPDLVFRNAYLSELSEGQIEVRVRVDSKAGGSTIQFTFKLPNGAYLGEIQSGRLNDVAKQLIVRILRYRN